MEILKHASTLQLIFPSVILSIQKLKGTLQMQTASSAHISVCVCANLSEDAILT